MRFFDLLKLSMRMFKARPMRTLLTVLGMSVGIAAIIFLVSLGYGLQRTLLQKITTSDALVTLDITPGAEESSFLTRNTITDIETIPNVSQVIPVLELSGQAKFDDITLDVSTVSSHPALLKTEGLKPLYGRLLRDGETDGIVITEGIARVFNTETDTLLERRVTLNLFQSISEQTGKRNTFTPSTRFTVIGIVSGDENIIYLPIDSLSGFPLTNYSKLKVKCASSETLGQVRQEIENRGYSVSSISETIDQANKVFSVIQVVLMVFGMIALIVSAIGMFNTMTIALLERTEEIGIMKAIGASNFNISILFIMESTLMGFLGALGGVILGLIEGEVLNFLVNVVATRFGGESVDLFHSPLWFILSVITFGAFVGFMTGLFPARKASHIDTLEALRYK